MITLTNIAKCHKVAARTKADDMEILGSVVTSDDRGLSIKKNIDLIVRNKMAIDTENAKEQPDTTRIAKFNENISTCMESVRFHAMKLGANQNTVEKIVNAINEGDFSLVTVKVLELMAKRNPGLNQKKYQQALQMISERNKNMKVTQR